MASRTPTDPYALGLAWLNRQELTEQQLRQRLRKRRVAAAHVDEAVARLQQAGALDDRRTAFAYARTAVRLTARGPRRVLQELAVRGIDRDMAREAVDAAFDEVDETARLAHALDKRLHGPIRDAAHRRRLHRALERQGFQSSSIAQALAAAPLLDDDVEDD